MARKKRKGQHASDPLPSDILLTLGDMGIPVERVRNNEAWALCPAHLAQTGKEDRKASWSINLDTGENNCFSCGWGGNFTRLVRWAFNWEDDQDTEKALEWIRHHGGIGVARNKLRGTGGFVKPEAEPVSEADLALFDDPPRSALLDKDVDVESCRAFGVMWDPRKKHWIFPIREPHTDRLMGWQAKGKGVFLNYPDHVEKASTVFGFNRLLSTQSTTAYLYESPIDAVRLDTYGLDGGVSSYGVHVSDRQMVLIRDEIKTLYVCLDNDEAGKAKSDKIWAQYRGKVKMFFANYEHTDKKDHGEMTPEDVEWSLNHAISAVRYRP